MATSFTPTFGGAVSVKAPAMFDISAQNPTGAAVTGLGQEVGKADGVSITPFLPGGIGLILHVDTDGNPNTP